MRRARFLSVAVLAGLLLVSIAACGKVDPRARILEQRARWTVTVLNLSQRDDGTIDISTRLSGPPNSRLQQLTVRVQLSDAAGHVIDKVWHTFDLRDVERGGPVDRFIRIPHFPREVFGAGIDTVPSPTPEETEHIPELRSAGS